MLSTLSISQQHPAPYLLLILIPSSYKILIIFSVPSKENSMATLALNYILLIAIPILVVLTLVITFLLVLLLKRKSRNSSSSSSSSSSNSNSSTSFRKSIIDKSQISNALDIGYSPDVRSCIYAGGKLIYSAAVKERKRGGQVFTYKELELATDGFSPENVIGNGGFGVVFRGTLRDGTEAAIKVLHREGKQGEREFRMEVDLLSRLHSCYLVALLGYCADQQHRLLVFEFLPNGSLQGHLHPTAPCKQHHRRPLDWCTRLQIALDCARGLEFLHERMVPAVIHRDFKCSNILLDHNFSAKVSDFGMAKTASDKVNGQVMTRVLGTSGYVAPEYASTGRLTTKSDVYSYGVVLLELLTGRVPIDSTRPPGEHALVSWALPRLTNREKVVEMVDPTLQGQYSKKDLIQVAAIAAVCVQSEAEYRPLITDVVQSLIPLVKSQDSSSRYHHQIVVPVS